MNDIKNSGGAEITQKAGGVMVRVVIYGERSEETEGLEMMLRTILTEKQQWPVIHTYIGDLESYLHFVRGESISDHAGLCNGRKRSTDCSENPG